MGFATEDTSKGTNGWGRKSLPNAHIKEQTTEERPTMGTILLFGGTLDSNEQCTTYATPQCPHFTLYVHGARQYQ